MRLQNVVKDILIITFGTAVVAVAVHFFLQPYHLVSGSIAGLSIVLAELVPLKVSTITMIINVVLLIMGFLLIGREFGAKTVYTSILLPAMIGVLEWLFPDNASLTQDAFTDMICYLFVVSFGQAILFACNASSGGLDIIGKIMNKFFHIELGKAIAMVGMGIALSSALVYDKKTVVLSLLGTYLNGIVLDHFIFGSSIKRRVCIISKEEREILRFILDELHSGATIYEAKGAYSDMNHQEIITIVDKHEYRLLMNYIAKNDPNAFVTVYNVNEIIYKPKMIASAR